MGLYLLIMCFIKIFYINIFSNTQHLEEFLNETNINKESELNINTDIINKNREEILNQIRSLLKDNLYNGYNNIKKKLIQWITKNSKPLIILLIIIFIIILYYIVYFIYFYKILIIN